ncbi:alpha/beta hydrolase family protein [Pseudomonadota bacterium]
MSKANESTARDLINDESGYEAHSPALSYHFSQSEVEFNFQWIAGSISTGGCELGEAFLTAQKIEDLKNNIVATPERWQTEWQAIAKRKEEMAVKSATQGHTVSARDAYLKASNYYRSALISMLPYDRKAPDIKNETFFKVGKKYKECFKEAAKLMTPPAEFFEAPLVLEDGSTADVPMPCYFVQPDDSNTPKPTLMMVGGGETYMEEMFIYIAPFALARGYNFLTFDLPGQGLLPTHGDGYKFRKDTETQIASILDEAIHRFSAIDPNRIVSFGISNGGYFLPRAATVERRIRALAVSNAVVDNYKMFQEMPFATSTPSEIEQWDDFKYNVTAAVAYRWGTDIKGQVEATKDFQFDPSLIECPCLAFVSSGELSGEAERQQYEFMEKISLNEKSDKRFNKMIISDEHLGAISHCIGENRSYMAQVLFDWFDEVLTKSEK